MSSIFLSHSSKDNQIAADIMALLAQEGHRAVFLDFDPVNGIPAGRNWENELYARLRLCRAVIIICSNNSMASRWCFAEITHAKALGKHIIPIKVDNCTLDPLLSDLQVIDRTTNYEDAYRRLFIGLQKAGLDSKSTFDWDGTRPPYPGLLSFDEPDAAIFLAVKI